MPESIVNGLVVILVTAGLSDSVAPIAESEVRTLSSFSEWVEADCFPDWSCQSNWTDFDQSENDILCGESQDSHSQLVDWLDRIRTARAADVQLSSGFSEVLERAENLDAFCGSNVTYGRDLTLACRTISSGSRYIAELTKDPNYRLMPFCLDEAQVGEWMRTLYYPNEVPPFLQEKSFGGIYGVARAAVALAASGFQGLHDTMADPPLSTLAFLQPGYRDVELIGLPHKGVQAQGCEVTDSKSQGALGIWRMLVRSGVLPEEEPMPALIGGWKGDRLVQVRCQGEEEGEWAWISRWRTSEAATTFAAHYPKLLLGDTGEVQLPMAEPIVEGSGVWIIPKALQHLESTLRNGIVVREFRNFEEWVESGCFPQESCRAGMASATVPDSGAGTSNLQ